MSNTGQIHQPAASLLRLDTLSRYQQASRFFLIKKGSSTSRAKRCLHKNTDTHVGHVPRSDRVAWKSISGLCVFIEKNTENSHLLHLSIAFTNASSLISEHFFFGAFLGPCDSPSWKPRSSYALPVWPFINVPTVRTPNPLSLSVTRCLTFSLFKKSMVVLTCTLFTRNHMTGD